MLRKNTPLLSRVEVHTNPAEYYSQRDTIGFAHQQSPQRGVSIPDSMWVGSKWLLASSRVPVTPGTSLAQTVFAMLSAE